MESRKRKPNLVSCPPSPLPNPPSSSSSIFRDISNFKTPRHPSSTPCLQASPQFFTASKNTPLSSSRRAFKSSALKSKAARRLKAFELEQSKSARKAQHEKEKSLKSLARSLTVWLNFLFENPSSCGCDPAKFIGESDGSDLSLGGGAREVLLSNGKRESGPGGGVGFDGLWRCPKRQRDLSWRGEGSDEVGQDGFSGSTFSGLKTSLQEICSFEDLKERMRMYLSLGSCKEIFEALAQVTKNIDEGRLKMRASCPIVSDVGMKEKAMRILMCYNPIWLRIGLYIILGGDSLLPNGDVNSEQENAFLRMVLEKQFLSHTGLAKAHAYNKQVEGLYRPGYYEKLGNVILKRFLLLVIIIDRAKSQTSLPLKYGIDGLDGGSPPLFSLKSSIKSSRQLILDFLSSDVMHGEGNVLAHLVIVGYKVTYQQNPLIEYDFKVSDVFEDLQDGVRLCRAIELLKHDSSILMKVVVPSDTQKKSLVNCGIALQYLKQAGVPLLDEDGTEILGEDVVNGDKELTLSLLWNTFVHLQLPLLISKTLLLEEISNIRGVAAESSSTQTLLDLLLSWIQAICESYELKIENQSSLLDGKAMWCLLDYYFRKEHDCSCSFKYGSQDPDGTNREVSIMSAIEYTDAVHNYILSQKLTSLLGNFPEVLQVSDILEHNGACNGQSVMVLLVFLSVQLLVKRNMDKLNFHKMLGFGCQGPNSRSSSTEWNNDKDSTRGFKAIMAWWQDMAKENGKCSLKPPAVSTECFLAGRKGKSIQRENAATIIQSHYRRVLERRNYMRIRNAALVLQSVVLTWLSIKRKASVKVLGARTRRTPLEKYGMYFAFMVDRHYFVNLKKSITVIQKATRAWIAQRHCKGSTICNQMHNPDLINAATVIQSCIRGQIAKSAYAERAVSLKEKGSVTAQADIVGDLQKLAAIRIQHAWRDYILNKSIRCQHSAATKIQSHYRGWLMRKSFACKKRAAIIIQRSFRSSRSRRDLQIQRQQNASVIIIQLHVRGWLSRRQAYTEKDLFIRIQSFCRGWLQRKEFLFHKDAATKIQSAFRRMSCSKAFISQRHAAIDIQRFVRGANMRRRLLGALSYHKASNHGIQGLELKILVQSVVKLQRWWRCVLQVQMKRKSAVVIQSHFRGWKARQMALREKQLKVKRKSALVIQSHFQRWKQRQTAMREEQITVKTKSAVVIQSHFRGWKARQMALREKQLKVKRNSALVIQSHFRRWKARQRAMREKQLKVKTTSAVVIQSHFRGWMVRQMAKRQKKRVVVIQSFWKGYRARKNARGELLDLRLRMEKSAANVDDSRRLINRLVAALSELLSMRSVSGILHTCATLDVATELSQKCCEELVAAGAVGTLLKLIRSVSRSMPDQQVLKHALSTLRNLARYPHLTEILVQSHGCVETILLEFVRNKEEGFFVASELLKKICVSENGAKAVRSSPALYKRLNNFAEELARKARTDKRKERNLPARQHAERRLKEVVELLKLIANANA
ncbi:abnormal spindle-like microcephaly-associated protein homolog isoform X1 [Sesamum indicum]|uniref:Abnormal spindle-like microcephaly-associated protein homolog isoform X1 n=1 Tax=Sesamum indicum TaxID=4182 RepID=A0A6I9UDB5_SESIN|nr:abnormal spindle-like microcephaly-associated protein homolog isoform X1 [Sesamum indicum]